MLDLRSVRDIGAKTLIRVFYELDRNIIEAVKTMVVKSLIEKFPRQRFGGEWRGNALEAADFQMRRCCTAKDISMVRHHPNY